MEECEELELDDLECQLYLVAKRTLDLVGHLIRATDLPKLRPEQEAVVVGRLAQSLFAELLAHERDQEDDDDDDTDPVG